MIALFRLDIFMLRILLFLFITFSASAENASCTQHHCIAIVDAGSGGSRVHIYAYDVDESNNPVNINELWLNKVKPGFATVDMNQGAIDNYLNSLFVGAPQYNLPVYFYATAGMRLLSQPKQQQYFQFLQQWFAGQSQWTLKDAQTITGSEEGLYGWLAVNYRLGSLTSNNKPLVGVTDMGGASVQIVFPVQNTAAIDKDDLIELDLYGRHLTLFGHSFLGLGQTILSQQFLDTANCFANNYQMPNGTPAQGDATFCQRDVSVLINQVHSANDIVRPALTANPVKFWYTIGGLTTLIDSKPFHFENHQLTSEALLAQGDSEVCHKQWQDLQLQYPGNDYLYGYCLVSSYYYALLVNGYGIPPHEPINYLENSQNIDWTLGVVLHPKI